MVLDFIKSKLLSTPEVSQWPEMASIIAGAREGRSRPCWEYPLAACRAAGGEVEQALPGAVAIFCLLHSIHIVDDLLDEDPGGLHHDLGAGKAANLALALQALGSRVIAEADLAMEIRVAIQDNLARTAGATAYGQHLDAGPLAGEEDYWRVVSAKTPPLFGSALYVGGLSAQGSEQIARGLEEVGFRLGKMIQISDDLGDALATPARPDWRRGGNNLAILYAMTADHGERSQFVDLLSHLEEPDALQTAQGILCRCGAVSYCCYHLLELHRDARRRLFSLPLPDPDPVTELLQQFVDSLRDLFAAAGVESPAELFGE